MENQNYTATIEVAESPRGVFNHVNDVSNWWAKDAGEALSRQKKEFEGQSTKFNNEFIHLPSGSPLVQNSSLIFQFVFSYG